MTRGASGVTVTVVGATVVPTAAFAAGAYDTEAIRGTRFCDSRWVLLRFAVLCKGEAFEDVFGVYN